MNNFLYGLYMELHNSSLAPYLRWLGEGWEIGIIVVIPCLAIFVLGWGYVICKRCKKTEEKFVEAARSTFMGRAY